MIRALRIFLAFALLAVPAFAQTAATRATLYTEIDTLFADTGADPITPAQLRQSLKNITASSYNDLTDGAVSSTYLPLAGGTLSGNLSAPNLTATSIITAARHATSGGYSASAWGVNGLSFRQVAANYTDTSSSGTVSTAVISSFAVPTLIASTSTTYTNAANVYIAGDAAAGANVALTNTYGLWNVGKTRLDGIVIAGSGPTTLTDSAGKILSAALNTVAVAQGGTGATDASTARTNLGLGTTDSPTFANVTAQSVSTSGRFATAGGYSAPAWGVNGLAFRQVAGTYTDSSTASSGTASIAAITSLAQPTIAATNSSVTVTDAANLYIAGDVAAGTNVTLTNSYGLWNVGKTRLDGAVVAASTITASGFIGDVTGNVSGSSGSTTGNAATATALATPRAIYGNNFDGSAALTQIIASTYGGTGNGFAKFSGPTTSEKTFTLPNSSATLLYAGGDAGTPSALVLTNATALPAAQVVAGALADGMTATTQTVGDNDTSLATTAFANAAAKATKLGSHVSPDTTGGSITWATSAVYEVWTNTTTTYTLPAASGYDGKAVIFYVTGTNAITIDPNSSEVIVRDGTAQTGGVTLTLAGVAGNYVCLICDGARWVTLGYKGVLAAGS